MRVHVCSIHIHIHIHLLVCTCTCFMFAVISQKTTVEVTVSLCKQGPTYDVNWLLS